MTLVVGRAYDGKIYMLGDTKITLLNGERTNPYIDGCLKQYLIADHLAIGFAGNREHIKETCSDFLSCQSSEGVIRLAISQQSNGSDFEIIIGDFSEESIYTVKSGEVCKSLVGYVGDPHAFNAFQENFHESAEEFSVEADRARFGLLKLPEPTVDGDIYGRMYESLRHVILDDRVPSVGGIAISLCTDQGKFCYLPYADTVTDQLNVESFSDEPKPIQFGTARGGGFTVDVSSDLDYGGDGKTVGLYCLEGKFGVIFPMTPNGFREAELVKAKNPAYWVLETKKRLGSGISSMCLSEDHCLAAGRELLIAEKEEEALYCFKLRLDSRSLIERPAIFDVYVAGYATALFNLGNQGQALEILNTHIQRHSDARVCREQLNKMQSVINAQECL